MALYLIKRCKLPLAVRSIRSNPENPSGKVSVVSRLDMMSPKWPGIDTIAGLGDLSNMAGIGIGIWYRVWGGGRLRVSNG